MTRDTQRKIVLWPVYFDKTKSWSQGRRVPRRLAVENPSLNDLAEAVKQAGYKFEIDKNAKYPAFWYETSGRILVITSDKKTVVIRRVAENLKRSRSKRT